MSSFHLVQLTEGRHARDIPKQLPSKKKTLGEKEKILGEVGRKKSIFIKISKRNFSDWLTAKTKRKVVYYHNLTSFMRPKMKVDFFFLAASCLDVAKILDGSPGSQAGDVEKEIKK